MRRERNVGERKGDSSAFAISKITNKKPMGNVSNTRKSVSSDC